MACADPAHQGIDARFRALEAEVGRIAPLEAEVAKLKGHVVQLQVEIAPLRTSHLHLQARSLLIAELYLIFNETGVPVAELAELFAGFHEAREWVKTHTHSTITLAAIKRAESVADKIADGNVRRKVRLAARGDAHPGLMAVDTPEGMLLDIMDSFPVTLPLLRGGRPETVTVADVHRVVRLFLTATGQHLLARDIKPRRLAPTGSAAVRSSAPGSSAASGFAAAAAAGSAAAGSAASGTAAGSGAGSSGVGLAAAAAAADDDDDTAALVPVKAQWRDTPARHETARAHSGLEIPFSAGFSTAPPPLPPSASRWRVSAPHELVAAGAASVSGGSRTTRGARPPDVRGVGPGPSL